MSARARLILAIVAAVVICALFFFLFVRSRQNELQRINDEIAVEDARTGQLQSELTRLRQLQENAPELRAELEEIRRLVPQNHEVANFIFLVQDVADESGVDFVDITPELPDVPPEGAPLAEVRMTITAEGGYFALQDFVRRLYDLERALRIDVFALSAEEEEDGGDTTVSMNATARIFFEAPGAPGAATTTTTTTTPAPTTTPPPATPATSP